MAEGKAYVDDTDPETMKKEREERVASANRSNSKCLNYGLSLLYYNIQVLTSNTIMATRLESVPPVFIMVNEIKNGPISEIDMCNAVINVINASKLDGVQKVHNIWRIYVKDKTYYQIYLHLFSATMR